jgi:hypothetical protein
VSGLDVFTFMMANVPFSGTAGKVVRIMVGDIARKHVAAGILGPRNDLVCMYVHTYQV